MRYYYFLTILLVFIILIFILLFSLNNHRVINSSYSIEQCQNGRVCTNSCYLNGQLTNCTEQNTSKTVLFKPSFGQIIPDVQLRLVQIDADETRSNSDVTLKKENLTPYRMDIHFGLSIDSVIHIFCADWIACSSDTNYYVK